MEMAFRSEAKSFGGVGLLGLLVFTGASPRLAAAQSYTYEVRHQHWRKGALGKLQVSADGISFEEHGKKGKAHSRQWQYEEIQQLTLSSSEIHILTYEDSKWGLGRDHEYVFDRLPKELAVQANQTWTGKLDQRFIAAVPELEAAPEWKIRAKLDRALFGKLGTLLVSQDRIVFDAGEGDKSRSWRLADIDNISRSGPFDFTVVTAEKSGAFRGGMRQFHFQLLQGLSDNQFEILWRRINRTKGLKFLEPETGEGARP
jgi:hypothetical protein